MELGQSKHFNNMKNYQNKPVRRGTPSARYREMHPFPTTKTEFGTPAFFSENGMWQLRVADGAIKKRMVDRGIIQNGNWGTNPLEAPSGKAGTQLLFWRIPRRTNISVSGISIHSNTGKNSSYSKKRDSRKKIPPIPGSIIRFVHAATGTVYQAQISKRSGSTYQLSNAGSILIRNPIPVGQINDAFVKSMEAHATKDMIRKMHSLEKKSRRT